MQNKCLFSEKENDYVKGRPSYAQQLIDMLYETVGFSSDSIIADIGSGTGKY